MQTDIATEYAFQFTLKTFEMLNKTWAKEFR